MKLKKTLIILKKTLVILLLFTVCISAAGCDKVNFLKKKSAPETEAPPDEPKPYPVTIDGVEIAESPQEIICLSPSLTEILFEFGEGERVVGKSEYCDYPLAAKDIEVIKGGSGFDAEKIIRRSPDLLLLSSPISERDRASLEREEIATVVIPAPRSMEEFRNVYRLVGLILYGAFVGADNGEVAFSDIFVACNNPDGFDMGNFVYITENLLIATGDTLESAVLSCFGENLAQNGKGYAFDKSELAEVQPDVVLLNNIYSEEDLLNDGVLSQLTAVREGRVVLLDNAFFEKPSARIIMLVTEMRAGYQDLL